MTTTTTANIFATAKKTEAKTSTATKKKEKVFVAGIETDLKRYAEIKKLEANLKTEKDMIGGKLKETGRTEWLKKYRTEGRRPDSFMLADGHEDILLIVMDAYKKVEEAKEAMLEEYGVLETKTTFTINAELLEKCGEAISNAIMNSAEISDEDKANLILRTDKTEVRKGTIDTLLQHKDPELLFSIIEPTIALK